MRVLYYDCFCGISGDMNLAALLDLGVDAAYLRQELGKLRLEAEYELIIKKDSKNGIGGTRVDVLLKEHEHVHESGHHHHEHGEEAMQHTHHHHHAHRSLKDIEAIIQNSDLHDAVKNLSLKIFMEVAKAEAKVHGKDLYEVHFHEVGAIDSIIDIVGAAICLEHLQVDKIVSSTVQLGGGFVKCAHGTIPVPAPATVEILRNLPVKSGVVPFETTTPTGAAILAANVVEFSDEMNLSVEKIGYGIGHRDLEIPNILRVYIGQSAPKDNIKEEQYILESNIDDMNPELYGYVEERLFKSGALDVFKTAISMKKGRMATKLSVLVNKKQEEAVLAVIFRETTSLGVRKFKVEKIMMQRDFEKVSTCYGDVTIKNAYYHGEKVKYKAEYEECKQIADENNIPIAKVYQEIYKNAGGRKNVE